MYSLLLLRLIAGIAGGILAGRKRRDSLSWAISCAFFPPLLFLLLVLPPKSSPVRGKKCPYCSAVVNGQEALCPACKKEWIELVQCSHCGNYVPEKEFCMECNNRVRS